ncbi:DNA polymerase III subunit alpha [Macrococcus hajekii]|uniref:DNA-directed DNA polymerase n=1 Tax=Macrococcus hajekii TaxID=198482 RepID=A0A4R6BLM6_9STAP|nr:DNA polymerase III subunit alpha [Macrococcus hajekii]TDM02703.1 DNA polymerase III subunit alpha [Macrococcus hajekii]GGB03196.1 DNA polymerase III subunit alpha [Macrococcus hajekii]
MVVQLNIHTAYDLLASTVRIDDLIAGAVADGQTALAITDTHVMFGVQAFYSKCLEAGIKPIIGMTILLTDGIEQTETVLLAENVDGYHNLMRLSSRIQLKELTAVPEYLLTQYSHGLIIIFKQATERHLELFDNSFGCHLSDIAEERKVYLSDVKYMKPDGLTDLNILQAIDSNQKRVLRTETGPDYFRTSAELDHIDPVYLQASEHIADRCEVEIPRLKHLPKFTTPNGESSDDYLWQLLEEVVQDYGMNYRERAEKEYTIIKKMGFSDYFLIVSDLIKFAKSKGILVGPGRGSSGGSLVSYLLDITMIDPLEHHLLFERFLNPERVTMPDIDIDFEDTRRHEVIDYCVQKYGAFNVSGIVTFGHLMARAVMRDVGRILQFSDADLKLISHLIPRKLGITLDDAYQNDEFRNFISKDDRHQQWFNIAKRLEGLPRHTSTHAAGIIIHDQILTDYVPLIKGDTLNLTQWTMTEVEHLGLLKIDFLGLRNLTIIQRVLNQTRQHFTTKSIDYHDKEVFKALGQADTTGIFQLESAGIRQVLRQLQPQHFEDIVAVLSLYRPGPMEQIPVYIERRHGQSFDYLHPDLEPILQSTYGVIIYQEQIMQIASRFAGFSLGEADNLRRAMSKKKRDVLEAEREHFITGSQQKGYDAKTAEAIYELIMKFADYGFPRAHAVAYAQIAYVMLFLKVHYPTYFYAATMSNVIGSEDKLAEIIAEVKEKQIPFVAPAINSSHWFFKADAEQLILSLGMIKGVGYRTVMEIVEERKKGHFQDIYDFMQRMPKRSVNRSALEAMIVTGVFDEFGQNRATLLASLDRIMDMEKDQADDHFLEALGLNLKKSYEERPEMSAEKLTNYEAEYLGFYLSPHPVEQLFTRHLYLPLFKVKDMIPGSWLLVSLKSVKRIRTKKGQAMAFAEATDGLTSLELVIFPDVYSRIESLLKEDYVVIRGKIDQPGKLIVEEMKLFGTFKSDYMAGVKSIYVLKEPEDELEEGSIDLYLFNYVTRDSVKRGSVNRETMYRLIEQYPPEMIRLI